MDGYKGTDAGWFRLWPLDEWKRVSEELQSDRPIELGGDVLVADHVYHAYRAWWYGIELGDSASFRVVRCCGAGDPWIVARSFDGYLRKALSSDPAIFGPVDPPAE